MQPSDHERDSPFPPWLIPTLKAMLEHLLEPQSVIDYRNTSNHISSCCLSANHLRRKLGGTFPPEVFPHSELLLRHQRAIGFIVWVWHLGQQLRFEFLGCCTDFWQTHIHRDRANSVKPYDEKNRRRRRLTVKVNDEVPSQRQRKLKMW